MIPGQSQQFFEAAAAQSGGAGYQIERSLRFNSADTAYLNRTPASAGNRLKWTWSAWVKRSKVSAEGNLFSVGASGTDAAFRFNSDDTLQVRDGGGGQLITNAVFRDPSAWYHIVVALDNTQSTNTDRFKVWVNGVEQTYSSASYASQNTEGDFNTTVAHYIGRQVHNTSHLFDGYLAEIHFVDGTQLAPTDFGEYDNNNLWQPKEYSGTYGTNGFYLDFSDNSSASALGTDSSGNSNTWTVNNITAVSALSTPVSAAWTGYAGPNWLTTDTWDSLSDATTNFGNNGGTKGYSTITETWAGTKTSWTGAFGASIRGAIGWALKFPSSVTITVNPSATVSITACASTSTAVSAGTLHTSFPVTMTGQVFWFRGTTGYPAVGIYNSVAIPANVYTDSLIDTPTNYKASSGNNGGNYATLNPLSITYGSGTLTNGNLELTPAGSDWTNVNSTFAVTSEKVYFEATGTDVPSSSRSDGARGAWLGLRRIKSQSNWAQNGTDTHSLILNDMGYLRNGGSGFDAIGAKISVGDVVGFAYDGTNGTYEIFFNGVSKSSGSVSTTSYSAGDEMYVATAAYPDGGGIVYGNFTLNFGQRPFAYTPPTGFKSLCTTNLPDPTIADGSVAMDVLTWTGTGTGADRTISGLGFSNTPGLIWGKTRSAGYHHTLWDIVRGYGTTNVLSSDRTEGEGWTASGRIKTATSSSITWEADNGSLWYDAGSTTYVAWNWDAGSSHTSISAGGLNSSLYLQDAAYNSQVSGTSQSYNFGSGGERGDNNMFDGDIKHSTAALGAGNNITWSGSIPFSSSFAIASDNDGGSTAINITHGPNNTVTNVRSQVPNTTNTQIAAGTIPITTLTGITSPVTGIELVASSTHANGICMVKADGRTVIDSGITVDNVPTIASTVRANASAGFSIVSYTGNGTAGATIGHGLNAAPAFVVQKNRDASNNWQIFHVGAQTSGALQLKFTTAAAASNTTVWNNTAPSSSVVTLGSGGTNSSSNDHIMYCWAPVEGYSAFGSYTGNGSADGPFVFTGFRPRWILLKRTDGGAENWTIWDTERNTFNVMGKQLYPNLSAAEADAGTSPSFGILDSVSNGFKLRGSHSSINSSGGTFIYAAYAEHPFASNARAR